MTAPDPNDLMLDLAREVVAETAPQELPLFKATSAAYLKNPSAGQPPNGRDDVLGFGGGEAVMFITPIAISIAKEVIAYLAQEAKKTLKTESAEAVNGFIKRLFKQPGAGSPPAPSGGPPAAPQPAPALTSAQVAEVHQIAYKQALAFKLPADRARLFADAMVGKLVLAGPAGAGPTGVGPAGAG